MSPMACREVEMNWKWQELVQFEQVGIGNEWDVHDMHELHGFGVKHMGHLHLEEVPHVVDKGHQVAFLGD